MNLSKNNRDRLINIKVTETELKAIKAKARRYTAGNLSSWIRYSSIELKPKAKDLKG